MLYFSWPCSCFWTGMKCNKVVELDGRELVSKKMKVVVSKVFAAAGMVKIEGLYDSDIVNYIERERGTGVASGRSLCREQRLQSYFSLYWDSPLHNMRNLPTPCNSDDEQ